VSNRHLVMMWFQLLIKHRTTSRPVALHLWLLLSLSSSLVESLVEKTWLRLHAAYCLPFSLLPFIIIYIYIYMICIFMALIIEHINKSRQRLYYVSSRSCTQHRPTRVIHILVHCCSSRVRFLRSLIDVPSRFPPHRPEETKVRNNVSKVVSPPQDVIKGRAYVQYDYRLSVGVGGVGFFKKEKKGTTETTPRVTPTPIHPRLQHSVESQPDRYLVLKQTALN